MRAWAAAFAAVAVMPLGAAEKLTFEDRVELIRGLTASYATAKQPLPRSRRALAIEADGAFDKEKWEEAGKEYGPAARVGDMVQITKIEIGGDKITLEINGGFRGGRRWYERVQVSGGMGGGGNPRPIHTGSGSPAPGGTSLEILFHRPLEPIRTAEVKKILAALLDFEQRTATELYADTLSPEIRQAVEEKKAVEGMDREQVLLAMGRPNHKSRETKDGLEVEDWVYGQPPGRIVFVTFSGDKVIQVKEAYAGLGTIAPNLETPR
jgi:hypothetical protein